MHSIIVVPGTGAAGRTDRIELRPGEAMTFGRHGRAATGTPPHLTLPYPSVSRTAGLLAATGTFWALSNLSRSHTYVVDNPEGAGEHIKVAPGRLDAPVPFEFARVVLPSRRDDVSFDVWAPRHDYADVTGAHGREETTIPAFPLDRGKRYFLVLAALTEQRLRGANQTPLPTVAQITERLRPVWPGVSSGAVQWNIDYLAVKLGLKPAPEARATPGRVNGKKELLAALALRFDLVREEDLAVLNGGPSC